MLPPLLFALGCAWVTEGDLAARLDLDSDGVSRPADCDDQDPAIGAAGTWYADADGDGWGGGSAAQACVAPEGFAAEAGDCDEGDPMVNPGATELCNEVDDDCDGTVDEGDAADASAWHADADGDGWGTPEETRACTRPAGYLTDGTDCDDADPAVHPGAEEVWYDGVDQDCDGGSDDDQDGDGYDADFRGGDDCDDQDPLVNPDREEACGDGVDNDCDGEIMGACAFNGAHTIAEADYALTYRELVEAGASLAALGDHDGDGFDDLLIGAPALTAHGQFWAGGALLVFGPLVGDVDLAHEVDTSLFGETAYGGLGAAVGAGGDVDGDGWQDLLAYADPNSGTDSLLVFSGPVSGEVAASEAVATFLPSDASVLGQSFSALGDQDGDGDGDLVLGDSGPEGACAYVYRGPVAGVLTEADADLRLDGESRYDAASIVAAAGDVDGDGIDDLAVGAMGASYSASGAGAVYLVPGPLTASGDLGDLAAARWDGEAEQDRLGIEVIGVGDLDGDGLDEVAAGAATYPTYTGRVYILGGPLQGIASAATAIARVGGEAEGDGAYNPAAAGDLNGDGRDDLLVRSCQDVGDLDQYGAVDVFLGALAGAVTRSDADGMLATDGVIGSVETGVGAGDLDGDGFPDIALGVPQGHTESGGNMAVVVVFVGGE